MEDNGLVSLNGEKALVVRSKTVGELAPNLQRVTSLPHIFIYHNICTTHICTTIYIPHYVYHNIPHIFALTLCLWLFPGPPNKAICPLVVGEKGCVVRKLVDNLKEMFISGLYRIYQINLDITLISLNIWKMIRSDYIPRSPLSWCFIHLGWYWFPFHLPVQASRGGDRFYPIPCWKRREWRKELFSWSCLPLRDDSGVACN